MGKKDDQVVNANEYKVDVGSQDDPFRSEFDKMAKVHSSMMDEMTNIFKGFHERFEDSWNKMAKGYEEQNKNEQPKEQAKEQTKPEEK